MNAVNPPVSSWSERIAVEVFDPLGVRLDVAEHHGGARPAAEAVPHPHDVQPVGGVRLALSDRLADAVHQDFRPAAGDAAEAGRLQPDQHLVQRQLVQPGEVDDLRRAEGVQVDRREVRPQVAEHVLVPVQLERRVHPALEQDLVAAEGDGFPDFLVQLVAGQHIGVGVAGLAVEGAEVAHGGADVGVVDVPVDVVSAVRLRVQPLGDGVSRPAELGQVAALEEGNALSEREPLAGDGFGKDTVGHAATCGERSPTPAASSPNRRRPASSRGPRS